MARRTVRSHPASSRPIEEAAASCSRPSEEGTDKGLGLSPALLQGVESTADRARVTFLKRCVAAADTRGCVRRTGVILHFNRRSTRRVTAVRTAPFAETPSALGSSRPFQRPKCVRRAPSSAMILQKTTTASSVERLGMLPLRFATRARVSDDRADDLIKRAPMAPRIFRQPR